MTDSYDQYADQLLNSAFQNARKTPAINTSHEDQLLNQLFQNARFSNGLSAPATPSPMYGNNNNEWFLLQQLQQQKMLLERQQQMMSPSMFHQVPIQSTSLNTEPEEIPIISSPPKKIARVPVHTEPSQVVLEDSISEPKELQLASLNNASNVLPSPPLNKKKSFLRSLSMRKNKKEIVATAAAIATTAIAAKTIQQQYNERKREEQERKREQQEKKKANKRAPRFAGAVAAVPSQEETQVVYESSIPQPKYIDKSPSFWKPREERPKGWWKGQKKNENEQVEYEQVIEYEEEESSEEEEAVPVVVESPKKTKNKVVVKRVAVPKPIPSIKSSKPKRSMAFKQPTPRKTKAEKKAAKKASKNGTSSNDKPATVAVAAQQPMYVMPQQMYQPNYYQQQPMMMAPQYMPGSYYPQMMGAQPVMPQQQSLQPEKKSSPARRKSVYNPRDNANDKCTIM